MKKIKIIYLLIIAALAGVFPANAQSKGAIQLLGKPEAGHELTIAYNPSLTSLKNSPVISVKIYSYNKDRKAGEQIVTLKPVENLFEATVLIPVQTVMLHIVPQTSDGQIVDNDEGKGYLFPVLLKDKPVAFAYFQMSQLASGIPSDDAPLRKNDAVALTYFKTELKNYPGEMSNFHMQFFNMLINSTEPKDKQLLTNELSVFQSDKEDELAMVQRYWAYLGNRKAADSLAGLLHKKFPFGSFVQDERLQAITAEKDYKRKTALYHEFEQHFPEPAVNGQQNYNYVNLYSDMGTSAIENGDTSFAKVYIQHLKNKRDQATLYDKIAITFQKDQKQEQALIYAKKGVALTDTTLSYKNWEPYLITAGILYDMGKYQEGLGYAYPAYAHAPSKDAISIYSKLLQADGQTTNAKTVLETAITAGKSSVGMKAQLKVIYEGEKNTIPFDTYLASLENQIPGTSHQSAGVSLINETAPPLRLMGLSGEPVNLAALKGKIVVLDFWATWCKPCVQSFPAMQQVMKQFPNVVFLYIATFEKGDAQQNVSKFAKDNAYRFQFLLDQKNNNDQSFKTFTAFKVSSIPYKIVLDKRGAIRFRTSGFNGNDDDLIRELIEVIHQLN